MRQEQAGKRGVQVPKMAVSKRFGRYKKEERKEEGEADVKEDPSIVRIIEDWRRLKHLADKVIDSDAYSEATKLTYGLFVDLLHIRTCKMKDITGFILAVNSEINDAGYLGSAPLGMFISALISRGRYMNYEIPYVDIHIDYLATCNYKNISVIGDAGMAFGTFMKTGKAEVKGDAGIYCGCHMEGGIILIQGNADTDPGSDMTGGIIHIYGNAGKDVGENMQGGEIHVEGEIESIGDVIHGKIFHKGKLIVDK